MSVSCNLNFLVTLLRFAQPSRPWMRRFAGSHRRCHNADIIRALVVAAAAAPTADVMIHLACSAVSAHSSPADKCPLPLGHVPPATAYRVLWGCISVIGPILWGHSGPLCHALSLLSLLLLMALWTSMRRRRTTVAACDSSDTW